MATRESFSDPNHPGLWTYFASDGQSIKIGRSTSPQTRRRRIQCGNPRPVVIVAIVEGDFESDLHERFDDWRLHGEWFKPDESMVAWIRDRCFVQPAALAQLEAQLAAETETRQAA